MDDVDIRKRIGQQIFRARKRLNLSQSKLATRLGKTRNAISGYENASRMIRLTDLPLLADVLEVPLEFFFAESTDDEEHILLYYQLPSFYQALTLLWLRRLSRSEQIVPFSTKISIIVDGLEKIIEIPDEEVTTFLHKYIIAQSQVIEKFGEERVSRIWEISDLLKPEKD